MAWLNDSNVSIISVGGKSEFWKYRNKLDELKIPNIILADFDFFLRQLSEFGTKLNWLEVDKDALNTLKGKLGDTDKIKKISQLTTHAKEVIQYIGHLKSSKNIFIMSGELEDFFTENCAGKLTGLKQGKEERAIHIVSNLIDDQTEIDALVHCEEYYEFLSMCSE